MKKMLALILAVVLAVTMAACGAPAEESTPSTAAGVSFHVVVIDLDGTESKFDYTSSADSVGAALQAEGLLEGEDGPYGLFIRAVNGIKADWDKDGTYWGFYINGEYALAGVDQIAIDEGATYTFQLTKG